MRWWISCLFNYLIRLGRELIRDERLAYGTVVAGSLTVVVGGLEKSIE